MPYRNRSNVGPTIAHPAPAAILIRSELRPNIWGISTATGKFRHAISDLWPCLFCCSRLRLLERGFGYFPQLPFRCCSAGKSCTKNQSKQHETQARLFPTAESVTSELMAVQSLPLGVAYRLLMRGFRSLGYETETAKEHRACCALLPWSARPARR